VTAGAAMEEVRVLDPATLPLSGVERQLLAEVVVAEVHARREVTYFGRVASPSSSPPLP
jgi:hypothetical protein